MNRGSVDAMFDSLNDKTLEVEREDAEGEAGDRENRSDPNLCVCPPWVGWVAFILVLLYGLNLLMRARLLWF